MQKTFILILIFIAGCATTSTNIHYLSLPEGAEIVGDSGKSYGQAPVTVTLTSRTSFLMSNAIAIPPVTAKWVSGATARYQGGEIHPGFETAVTLMRPISAPNKDIDEELALKIQQNGSTEAASPARKDME